jgi:hypothetical protein
MIALLAGGWMFQMACARQFRNEIEVLYATPANTLAVPSSLLVKLFGFQILQLFN